MADNIADALPSFFWANSPNINQQLRQRIAMSMMSQKKGYPKNIGEGLSAIGDSIGDIGLARMLERQDQTAQGIAPPTAPAAPASYAPTSDVPPAVAAIDRAITPGAGPDATPAAEPTGAEPGVSDGGYNLLDAQAGMKRPGQGRVQDTVERLYPDNPDMQAYASQLAAGEQAKPGEVSSTGARGPWQFVPGTAAQYGLKNPDDINASGDALKQFTADNAATFERINGRPPTMAELAVMHQQGGVTGAKMVAGTGNASPNNLALNNVNPASAPAQAIQGIKNYYGMPDRAVDPRARIAAALATRTAPGVPQPNPTGSEVTPPSTTQPAGGDQRIALAAPPTASDIQPAPPVPSQIRAMPQQQVAQAQPGYVTPQPGDPAAAPIIPMKPREIQLRQWLAANQGNPYAAMKVAPELGALEGERTTRQTEANELYKAKVSQQTELVKMREQQLADQAKRVADIAHTQAQTRKENIVENPEDKYMMGPDGVVRPIRVEGEDPNAVPSGKLTEDQRKTLVYHGWAKTGNQAITGNDQLLAHGFQQEALGKIPYAGNAAQNDAYRQAKNGADNFILAFMRSTSGAQYGATERLDHARAMLPRFGDDAKTLADKANQRQQFVDSEYAGLGRQGQKMADFLEKKHDPAGAERKQQLVDIEMQGVKGNQVGEVKTNRKTGAQRMWNGTRWVETQ